MFLSHADSSCTLSHQIVVTFLRYSFHFTFSFHLRLTLLLMLPLSLSIFVFVFVLFISLFSICHFVHSGACFNKCNSVFIECNYYLSVYFSLFSRLIHCFFLFIFPFNLFESHSSTFIVLKSEIKKLISASWFGFACVRACVWWMLGWHMCSFLLSVFRSFFYFTVNESS